MSKRDQKFGRIEKAKERFRQLSSEKILERLNTGYINEEGQLAYREVLQERGDWPLGRDDLMKKHEETRKKLHQIEEKALLKRHHIVPGSEDT